MWVICNTCKCKRMLWEFHEQCLIHPDDAPKKRFKMCLNCLTLRLNASRANRAKNENLTKEIAELEIEVHRLRQENETLLAMLGR